MRRFEYLEAENLPDLLDVLDSYKEKAKVNAGGTDLLSLFKDEYLYSYPEVLVNIKKVEELNHLDFDGKVLRIGPLFSLSSLAKDPLVKKIMPALAVTASMIATPEIRNMATVGGNLCQDVRCWYYRYPMRLGGPLNCVKKGGRTCLAVSGDNRYHGLIGERCYAPVPSDIAITLSSLSGSIIIASKKGERRIEISSFYGPMGCQLMPDEIVKEIEIPYEEGSIQNFMKYSFRKAIDFAIVSVATNIKLSDFRIEDCRITFGGISYRPYRAYEVENFIKGERLTLELIDEVSKRLLSGIKPLSKNAYKIDVSRGLLRKVLSAYVS